MHQVFCQTGPGDDSAKWGAVALTMLKQNPEWLKTREGRDVYRIAREFVQGYVWEELVDEPREKTSIRERYDKKTVNKNTRA